LDAVGEHERAIEASEHSVKLYRRVVAQDPGAAIDLARALNNLALHLYGLGHWPRAERAATEAISLHRRQAEPDLVALAGCLNTRTTILGAMGDRDRSLADIAEAVDLLDSSGHDDTAFELSIDLVNLSIRLRDTGRQAEAIAAIRKAVALQRRLADERPDAFTHNLAGSLNILGSLVADRGEVAEGLALLHESLEIQDRHSRAQLRLHWVERARTLSNIANFRALAGDPTGGLAAIEDAVLIAREYGSDTVPDRALLAQLLNSLSVVQAETGRTAAALSTARAAVDLFRALAATNEDAFGSDLANAINTHSVRLAEADQWSAAVDVAEEAVDRFRKLQRRRSEVFSAPLAMALGNQAYALEGVGELAEALGSSTEAIDIYRDLVSSDPFSAVPELARWLNNRGIIHKKLGRLDASLADLNESLRYYRDLVRSQPARFLHYYAGGLHNLVEPLARSGRFTEALQTAHDSVRSFEQSAAARPGVARDGHLEVARRTVRYLEALRNGQLPWPPDWPLLR
jgi:tetratricopeptide (TPR) repeat protein